MHKHATTPMADGVLGYRWLLVGIDGLNGHIETSGYPAEAYLDLAADGFVSAFNTVNALSGPFTISGDGFHLVRWASTLLRQRAQTAEQQAVLDAFVALGAEARDVVPVDVVDTNLVVRLSTMRMVFRRAGRLPDRVPPRPPTERLGPGGNPAPIPPHD